MFASTRFKPSLLVPFGIVVTLVFVLLQTSLAKPQTQTIELVFTYGSEKKEWLTKVTADYLATNPLVNGQPVTVTLIPIGSGECLEAVRDPQKWDAAAEVEVQRAKEEIQRYKKTIEDLKGKLLETPNEPLLVKRLADTKQRLVDAEKIEKNAIALKRASQAHLTSPASRAFMRLANAECRLANQPNIVNPGNEEDSLVQSAVVIAMWEDLARALGWPDKPIGWADIYKVAQLPKGWDGLEATKGKNFGRFKFGHTNPYGSNSGLHAVFAEAYYGADKIADLTLEDIKNPLVAQRMAAIERSVLFYGQSTGFFGDLMVSGGPSALSAGILYEDQVIKANDPAKKLPQRLVAIYPAEGTFMSDHPVAVVERSWVTADHKLAAENYISFLKQKPQQRQAMNYGFRPGIKLDLDANIFSLERGVDANQPRNKPLPVPKAEVMKSILKMWGEVRKPLRVALVLDTSGSMVRPDVDKFEAAKKAAIKFVSMLKPNDELTLLAFNSLDDKGELKWAVEKPLKMDEAGKAQVVDLIKNLRAEYQTALYDAIAQSFAQIEGEKRLDVTTAIIVLSDGADNGDRELVLRNGKLISVNPDRKATDQPKQNGDLPVLKNDVPVKLGSTTTFPQLLVRTKFNPESSATRIFTIAYGEDADPETLDQIAKGSRGVMYPSTPGDIERILKLILQDQ